MDYSKFSDLEINLRVAEIIYPGKKFTEAYSFGEPDGPKVQWIRGYAEFLKLDYCNNPADAWPIIVENEISIVSDSEWIARYGSFYSTSKNPLRAAMICYLMMQESE